MARHSSLRASDADRDAVADRLRQASVEGRLEPDELEDRLHSAFRARTYGELDRLLTDLPARPVPLGRRRADVAPVARMAVVVATRVLVVLAVITVVVVALALSAAWWLLFAAAMAVYSAVLQLVAAVSSITFVLVTGIHGLLGLGPAIFLVASALTAVPAGRAMDRVGRRPVVAGGYLLATAGCGLTALATNIGSTPVLILGFVLTGAANGIALLIRTAAGDMYPPERRARGISYVLFGSVFGAILGPAVFGPLFAGREVEAAALTTPWLVAAGISFVP